VSPRQNRAPLFHARILKDRLAGHAFPADLAERHAILKQWVLAQQAGELDAAKEVSLHGDFLGDVFGRALGYRTVTGSGAGGWELSAEKTMGGGGKSADGALGFFSPGARGVVVVPIELKGSKQSLDHAMGRVHTPVEQAWDYANHSPGCRWILVSNYKETRLYSTARTPDVYEEFLLLDLEDVETFKRFYFLLAREHLLGATPGGVAMVDELLSASARVEAEITQKLYEQYRDLRSVLYQDLCRRHSNIRQAEVLQYAQTILDRILFIAFAEDRGLLPADTIKTTCDHRDKLRPAPVWQNFCTIFQWIDKGHEAERYPPYNGGLFQPNVNIDELDVTDDMCGRFKELANYDFREDVSVDVLGHIFEQSITDLEELRRTADDGAESSKLSKRKTEGIYYTPAFVTQFIVKQTLGRVLDERWQTLLTAHWPVEKKPKEGSTAWKAAWTATYEAYREEIKQIRVLDLSCGSGAFLIAAFDALSREYDRVNAELADLRGGQATIFDLTKTVLNNNLFGVDLNRESVEITKLSLWLKTAERGRKLTYLDSNIKWGNSIVRDPMVDPLAFDWKNGNHVKAIFDPTTAPEAAEIDARWREGFDVVIGNPPYVRHERLTKIKDHLENSFRVYDGMADLFVYFFERGITVLKPGGRLGFIVANKWLRGGYGEPLRKLLAEETYLETLVDFGHAPIFPDADAFPCIVTISKPPQPGPIQEERSLDVTVFPREELRQITIPEYVMRHHYEVPQSRLGAASWSLESPELERLLAKVRAVGTPLTTFSGVKPYYGLKTGCNEAFVIDIKTRRILVDEDPSCEALIKPFLRGQDISRWAPASSALWMIYVPWGLAIEKYPSLLKHLTSHRTALEGRAEVRAGRFPWYALSRYASDYWDLFAKPKIFYPDIAWRSDFCLDRSGLVTNNTGYFLPTDDLWVLAVLNSPLLWSYCWRGASHGKDEALRLFTDFMVGLPIAPPASGARAEAEAAVTKLIAMTKADNDTRAGVLDSLRMQFAVAEPGNKLSDFASLASDAFVQEVLKRRPKAAGKLKAADMKALRELYNDEALPVQARKREALALERRLSALVNEAYGLTPEEVALLWSTAPPRMPLRPE